MTKSSLHDAPAALARGVAWATARRPLRPRPAQDEPLWLLRWWKGGVEHASYRGPWSHVHDLAWIAVSQRYSIQLLPLED